MTDSVKNFPIIKDKSRFMQKYLNRKERRLAKENIQKGNYGIVEDSLVPHGDYDVSDYSICYCWGIRELPADPRKAHKIIGK